jgi:hypothetical protein
MKPKLFCAPVLGKAGKLYSQIGNDFTVVRNLSASFRGASGLLEFAAPNVPRFEFPVGGGCPYLLREGEAENVIVQSNGFDTGSWSKSGTATPASGISPDGTNNAYDFTGSFLFQSIASGGFAASIFFKRTVQDNVVIRLDTISGQQNTTVDIANGIIVFAPPLISAEVVNYGGGWYRFELVSSEEISLVLCAGSFLIYGAQLEIGSEATSYIPTTTTPVTRPADVITAPDMAGATVNTFAFEDGSTTEQAAGGTIQVPVGKIKYIKQD